MFWFLGSVAVLIPTHGLMVWVSGNSVAWWMFPITDLLVMGLFSWWDDQRKAHKPAKKSEHEEEVK